MMTLRQSLLKSENVCYNVTVRGGEAAKWGTTDDSSGAPFQLHPAKEEDDEGYGDSPVICHHPGSSYSVTCGL
uniref:Uncharacterized protein n=1 Tax=Anopheles epiroticus TaxID=199890 RepID=A0A182PX20_9DIPT